MKLIDKDALVAEIERLHKAHSGKYERDEAALILEELEDFIDTLKAKEVNIEEEITFNYNPVNGLEFEEFERIAKYFIEFGLSINNPITAADRGTAEEIITNLKRVEQDYRVNLTKEIEWLRNKVKKGEEV